MGASPSSLSGSQLRRLGAALLAAAMYMAVFKPWRRPPRLALKCAAASSSSLADTPFSPDERFQTPAASQYDYNRSTQQNHCQDAAQWIGPYAAIRAKLDHQYHGYYTKARQRLQDDILKDIVHGGSVHAARGKELNDGPWIVFTAGAMGAGKGYVVRWMSRKGIFPLPDIVQVDPGKIRSCLPEWPGYILSDQLSAGVHTRRESGYIVEIAQEVSMKLQKNVWVDGSLRDHAWYRQVFATLRKQWPAYRIAIFNVYADKQVVMQRAKTRAAESGREVPESELLHSIRNVPKAVEVLSPLCDFVAHIKNDPSQREPQLEKTCQFSACSMQPSWNEITSRFVTAKALVDRSLRQSMRADLNLRILQEVADNHVVVYSKTYCTFCTKVKKILREVGHTARVIELDVHPGGESAADGGEGLALQVELSLVTGSETVPQVFVGGTYVGGCDTILAMKANGTLLPVLDRNWSCDRHGS